MASINGKTFGKYKILSTIGAGGMGEVSKDRGMRYQSAKLCKATSIYAPLKDSIIKI